VQFEQQIHNKSATHHHNKSKAIQKSKIHNNLQQIKQALRRSDTAPLSEEAPYYRQKCLGDHVLQFLNQSFKYTDDVRPLSSLGGAPIEMMA